MRTICGEPCGFSAQKMIELSMCARLQMAAMPYSEVAERMGAKGSGVAPTFCQNSMCRSLKSTRLPMSESTASRLSEYCEAEAKASAFQVVPSNTLETKNCCVPGFSTTK